ncbi:MAG: LPS export ABC transporter periplasmic protein LptC [Bernardetiaceae bacterium]|nr:LPS export ABC transporter periplasmic protein LptC [Bernardetiaceae bacterium]
MYSLRAIAILLLVACADDEIDENALADDEPQAIFENIKTHYSEEAQLKLKIEAPKEIVFADENVDYPEGIKITMYDERGVINTTLTADTGRYEQKKKIYHAYGNVVVINHLRKQRAESEELHWDERKREIYTELPITVITQYETLKGIGMTSNEKFDKYTFLKPQGTFIYKESPEQNNQPIDNKNKQTEAMPIEQMPPRDTNKVKKPITNE